MRQSVKSFEFAILFGTVGFGILDKFAHDGKGESVDRVPVGDPGHPEQGIKGLGGRGGAHHQPHLPTGAQAAYKHAYRLENDRFNRVGQIRRITLTRVRDGA